MTDTDDLQGKTFEAEATTAFSQDDAMDQEDFEGADEERVMTIARKRAMVHGVIAAFAAASATVATLPLPVKDAVMLSPIELAEVNALARVYDIPREESVRKIIDAIMQLGVVSMAARGAIGVVDKTVRLRAASTVKSAVIAAVIVAGIGASTAYAFEQIYLGKRSLDDLGLYRRFKKSERWQAAKSSAVSKLHEVTDEATLDGIALSIVEMLKTLAPTT